jgi:predicted TIM-barrel fold metal-dependent hydrolase
MAADETPSAPNSTGCGRPAAAAPPGAADCHLHIYDPRFALAPGQRAAPANATVADYRRLQRRIGVTRAVVVQPRNYGTDNRATLDAVAQMGADARAVAVVGPQVTAAELAALDAGGVAGVRCSLTDPASAVVKPEMVEPLAARVAELGWHVQVMAPGALIAQMADVLKRLPATLVVDHLGFPPMPEGVDHPSHRVVLDLLQAGRAWVKLSGAYLWGQDGRPHPQATPIARSFVAAAPERLVWGSDWPHPTIPEHKPDDAALFDLLAEWAPDAAVRERILVRNPQELYGFGR